MKSNNTQFYHLSRQEKRREQYRYAAKALLDRMQRDKVRLLGVTASQTDRVYSQQAFLLLARELSALEPKTKVLVLDEPTVEAPAGVNAVWGRADPKWLKERSELLEEETILLVYLPPVHLFVNSLDCLSLCQGAVLLERYGYTPYHGFEETLWKLKERHLPVLGIVAGK